MKFSDFYKYGLSTILAIGLVASYKVGWTIAQSAQESPNGGRPVSEPEPSKIPVKDQEKSPRNDNSNSGIDPELGSIQEPDSADIKPALTVDGAGDWKTPEQLAREKAKAQAQLDAEKLLDSGKGVEAAVGELPRLLPPNIPIIPINLLFPQSSTIAVQQAKPKEIKANAGVFFGLNRDTGQSLHFRVNVGQTVRYEQISVKLSGCFRSTADQSPEAWAYVDVVDNGAPPKEQLALLAQRNRAKLRESQEPKLLRHGWIIASSPDVTPIDHPIYDLYLVACEGGVEPAPVQIADANPPIAKDKKKPAPNSAKPKPKADAPKPPEPKVDKPAEVTKTDEVN